MKRRLLPAPEQERERSLALVYAQADFTDDNDRFLRLLRDLVPGPLDGQRALALGCGPADSLIRFLKAWPGVCCDVLTSSIAELEVTRVALESLPGIARRCRLLQDTWPSSRLAPGDYDLILSNGLLHRLPDPGVFWQGVRDAGRFGTAVLVMDLMRPPSPGWAESLVATYVGEAAKILRNYYRAALFAAFEPAEVQAQLVDVGLDALAVSVISDRHLAVRGWLPVGQ